jgi:hypothetical protein
MFLFAFDRFIAPAVIKFFYYLGLLVVVFGGLGVIAYAITEFNTLGAQNAAAMIGATAVGVPAVVFFMRFVAEMWLVVFEMNRRLSQMNERR